MTNVASHESLAAMGDLVSKLVQKHGQKNKQVLDGDFTIRKRKKVDQASKKELGEKRKRKKELLEMGKLQASSADVILERKLNKIATQGIIQLFNAVKQHQKDIDLKLKNVKTEAQREKISQTVTTGSFLDLVRPKEKVVTETETEDKRWNVLKDDFLMNTKPKEWEKGEIEEEEESDGNIVSEDSDEDLSDKGAD